MTYKKKSSRKNCLGLLAVHNICTPLLFSFGKQRSDMLFTGASFANASLLPKSVLQLFCDFEQNRHKKYACRDSNVGPSLDVQILYPTKLQNFCNKNTLDAIRTHDLPLRRRLLYPAELPGLTFFILPRKNFLASLLFYFLCFFLINFTFLIFYSFIFLFKL